MEKSLAIVARVVIVLILLILLTFSSVFGAIRADTIKTTTNLIDSYISSNAPLQNYGDVTAAEVNKNTRMLIAMKNLRNYISSDRVVVGCTLVVMSGVSDVQNTHSGTLSAYKIKKRWVEGNGWFREGVLWDYYYAPLYPDTVPQANLPANFSYTDSGLDGDAKFQGTVCGSCAAFGNLAAAEDAFAIQSGERLLSYNSGNGVGADRQGVFYDSLVVTSTGWKVVKVPTVSFRDAYIHDSLNCGFPILHISGEFTITTSEALARGASDHRPRFFGVYELDSAGQQTEPSKDNIGSSLIMETVLKGGADSNSNFGSDTAITLNSTNKVALFRVDNIKQLYGTHVIGWAQQYCSLYVQAKVTDGKAFTTRALKKWVEDQATYKIWKTNTTWTRGGTLLPSFLDLSEQLHLDCNPSQSCLGGNIAGVFDFSVEHGDLEEKDDPYNGGDAATSCPDTTGKMLKVIKWWWPVNTSSIGKLKQAILQRPVTFTEIVYPNYYAFSGSGVFVGTGIPSGQGHQVLIVGWSDTISYSGGTGAWLVRNSWSTLWGNYGRAWTCYTGNTPIQLQAFNGSSALNGIVETIQSPKAWSNGGMQGTQDFDQYPMSTIPVTRDLSTVYKIPIDPYAVNEWLSDSSKNNGVVLRPTIGTGLDSLEVYLGLSESTGNGGAHEPPAAPYFVIYSVQRTFYLGKSTNGKTTYLGKSSGGKPVIIGK